MALGQLRAPDRRWFNRGGGPRMRRNPPRPPKRTRPPVPQPAVVFEPYAQPKLQVGINTIAEAVKPTLGPMPRVVAVNNVMPDKAPELLDNGAAIARRIFAVPDRSEDVGAMLLRHALWQVHETVGDGTATAAILFQAIYNGGRRFIAAGGNAMLLRARLSEKARKIALALDDMSTPVRGAAQLRAVAASICHEPALARALGQAFETLGEYGQLDLRKAYGRGIAWEYVDGAYWDRGIETRSLLEGEEYGRVAMTNVAVLISDLKLEQPRRIVPLVMAAMRSGRRGLLLIANEFSDDIKAFLLANQSPAKFGVIAVRAPFSTPDEQREALDDIALMTGGTPIITAAGQTLSGLRLSDLGKARQAWASKSLFGFTAGGGDAPALRDHARRLQAQYHNAPDLESGQRLLKRLGKLMGGSVTLYTGGASESEIEYRRDLAARAAATLRAALREGVVPGAGLALLGCRRCLSADDRAGDSAARAASHILNEALAAPARVIAENAGLEGGQVIAELDRGLETLAFDARRGRVLPREQAEIYDVTSVVKSALMAALSGATQALTIHAIVHHRDPELTYTP